MPLDAGRLAKPGTNVDCAGAARRGTIAAMRRALHRITAPFRVIGRVGLRGARRWADLPAGVGFGLIVGLVLTAFVWNGAGWMALVLLLWSLPAWIDRAVPGGVRRVLRTIRRKPAIGILPLAAPLTMIHLLVPAMQVGGATGAYGALAGLLLPFALGIPQDSGTVGVTSSRAGSSPASVPGFVKPAAARLTNVGPALLTLAGAAVAAGGAFLPWAWFAAPAIARVTVDGLYGDDPLVSDGALAIGLAIAIAIVALVRLGARGQAGWRRGVAIAGGLGLITVAIWHGGQLAGVIAALQPPASGVIGPGIGVVGFGGALALIGGVLPGRPARLATDFLTVPSTPFQVVEKKSRRSPFARG
jgi:hypothetical protein